jgi:hypothetical protein
MNASPANELFFERARRVEGELRAEKKLTSDLILQLGERDVEIARLREALQAIVVECDGCGQIPSRELREKALTALEHSNGH